MASPAESGSYRYYSASERVHSRPMDDWLKYSVSLTDFRSNGINFSTWNLERDTSIRDRLMELLACFSWCSIGRSFTRGLTNRQTIRFLYIVDLL